MYLNLSVVLVLLSLGVWLLGSVGTVRAWHVFALSIISMLLMGFAILRMPDLRWIVFSIGLVVGVMSLVRSYQYRAVLEVEKQERFQQQIQERLDREREEGHWTQEDLDNWDGWDD